MEFIDVFKLANNVKGTFVEIGFGKGITARKAFNSMNDGTITKRQSWLIDSFKGTSSPTSFDSIFNPEIGEGYQPGRFQVAMDMRYDLINPSEDVIVLQSFVSDNLNAKYTGGTIACLHIDLPTYSGVARALEELHPKLNLNAVVFIGGYSYSFGIKNAVDNYVKENNLKYQLIRSGQSVYLLNKVAPVKFIPPTNVKSYFTPEETVVVSRPKVNDFPDRYTKPIVEKFKVKKDILNKEVDKLIPSVNREVEFKPEDTLDVVRTKVTPFEDRYVKPTNTPFKSKEVIKDGLNVINKKVTR